MSQTWDLLSVKRPSKIPCTVKVSCEKSVEGISPKQEIEKDGELHFIIGPTFVGSPVVERRLTFSYEKVPSLEHKCLSAGEIEPGTLSHEENRIYLFLEE